MSQEHHAAQAESAILTEEPPTRRRQPHSMIAWVESGDTRSLVPEELSWSDLPPSVPVEDVPSVNEGLMAFMAAADAPSISDALAVLAGAATRRWGCDRVVCCFQSTSSYAERLVRAWHHGEADVALTATLTRVAAVECDQVVRAKLGEVEITAVDLPVGAEAGCSLWLAWDQRSPMPERLEEPLLRAAGLALRAALASDMLSQRPEAGVADLVRRDRRDAVVGRLAAAGASSLLTSHANLAVAHASLEFELASLRASFPGHPALRATMALVNEATDTARAAGLIASGIASLGDESTKPCNLAQTLPAIARLVETYVNRRARVEVRVTKLPLVRSPAFVLAEVVVVFVTRLAAYLDETVAGVEPATIEISTAQAGRAVEIDVSSSEVRVLPEHDDVIAEVYDRELASRCGGAVRVLRDDKGVRVRIVVPTVA